MDTIILIKFPGVLVDGVFKNKKLTRMPKRWTNDSIYKIGDEVELRYDMKLIEYFDDGNYYKVELLEDNGDSILINGLIYGIDMIWRYESPIDKGSMKVIPESITEPYKRYYDIKSENRYYNYVLDKNFRKNGIVRVYENKFGESIGPGTFIEEFIADQIPCSLQQAKGDSLIGITKDKSSVRGTITRMYYIPLIDQNGEPLDSSYIAGQKLRVYNVVASGYTASMLRKCKLMMLIVTKEKIQMLINAEKVRKNV